MPQRPAHRYSLPAIALHWLMAAGLIGAIGFGWYISELPMGLQKLKMINWHKWVGITLLMLFVLRLGWRLVKRPPPPAPQPLWQARTASAVHGLLYLLMAVVPLLGWTYSSAAGFPWRRRRFAAMASSTRPTPPSRWRWRSRSGRRSLRTRWRSFRADDCD